MSIYLWSEELDPKTIGWDNIDAIYVWKDKVWESIPWVDVQLVWWKWETDEGPQPAVYGFTEKHVTSYSIRVPKWTRVHAYPTDNTANNWYLMFDSPYLPEPMSVSRIRQKFDWDNWWVSSFWLNDEQISFSKTTDIFSKAITTNSTIYTSIEPNSWISYSIIYNSYSDPFTINWKKMMFINAFSEWYFEGRWNQTNNQYWTGLLNSLSCQYIEPNSNSSSYAKIEIEPMLFDRGCYYRLEWIYVGDRLLNANNNAINISLHASEPKIIDMYAKYSDFEQYNSNYYFDWWTNNSDYSYDINVYQWNETYSSFISTYLKGAQFRGIWWILYVEWADGRSSPWHHDRKARYLVILTQGNDTYVFVDVSELVDNWVITFNEFTNQKTVNDTSTYQSYVEQQLFQRNNCYITNWNMPWFEPIIQTARPWGGSISKKIDWKLTDSYMYTMQNWSTPSWGNFSFLI